MTGKIKATQQVKTRSRKLLVFYGRELIELLHKRPYDKLPASVQKLLADGDLKPKVGALMIWTGDDWASVRKNDVILKLGTEVSVVSRDLLMKLFTPVAGPA